MGHTFSLYLQGGAGTRRLDAGAVAGWPGAVCVMPEGHRSDWEIGTPFRFVHLYMPDDMLRGGFARIHDCDARRLDLRDLTFVSAPGVALPLTQMARAAEDNDILLADTAIAELVAHLPRHAPKLSGGLPPHILRRVDDWVEAHLDGPVRLADLAGLADLSGFHFHRMFRLSRGVAPHVWITARRTDRAKAMLQTTTPIAEIAAACGFSSQSHMTRVFGRQTGMTPARYRALSEP